MFNERDSIDSWSKITVDMPLIQPMKMVFFLSTCYICLADYFRFIEYTFYFY